MTRRVFIGGASQSGKSTLARLLVARCQLKHINIDADPIIAKLRPYLTNRFGLKIARSRASYLINNQPLGSVSEVSFFSPKSLQRNLRPDPDRIVLYVGCPNIVICEKIALLRANNFKHSANLRAKTDAALERSIGNFKKLSIRHQEECSALGIPFYDVSDVTSMSQVQSSAADWVLHQLEQQNQN